jgi:hypothetical protein
LGCLGKKLLASEISYIYEKDCFQFGAVDCLIGWRLFHLSFAQADREGENRLHLRMVVSGEQPVDYHPADQGSGLVSANDAERPAASWHGVKESILIQHVVLQQAPPCEVKIRGELCSQSLLCVHESQVKVSVLAIL